MFDSDEKFNLVIALVVFWLLCGAIAASFHYEVEVLTKLLTVGFVIMMFALLSFSAEVIEELDRAKWFWCPLILVLPPMLDGFAKGQHRAHEGFRRGFCRWCGYLW